MDHIKDIYTFGSLKRVSKASDDHNFAHVHMLFDVKFYQRNKVILVEGGGEGGVAGARENDAYCRVVNI